MVRVDLTDDLRIVGSLLVRKLDECGLKPKAAFWLRSSETEDWQLVISSEHVAEKGPLEVYGQIQKVLLDTPNDFADLRLDDITVVRPDMPVVTALRTAMQTGDQIRSIRFTGNVVNGTLIEDALVYRST